MAKLKYHRGLMYQKVKTKYKYIKIINMKDNKFTDSEYIVSGILPLCSTLLRRLGRAHDINNNKNKQI